MEVDNDTNTPVNYDQSGSGPDIDLPEQLEANPRPSCPNDGNLEQKGSGHNTATFVPGCRPPWTITFTDPTGAHKPVTSPPLKAGQIRARVTLNPDWTITVSD